MKKEIRSDLQKVLDVLVETAEKRLTHFAPGEADAVRSEIRRIAAETASPSENKAAKPLKRVRARSRKRPR